jgi:hypothetical protein
MPTIATTISTSCQRGRFMNRHGSTRRRAARCAMMPAMIRLVLIAGVALALTAPADAAPKKKYHYELTQVTADSGVAADVSKSALPRVEAQVRKAFNTHPQLVGDVTGAPDPNTDANGYRKFLVRKGLADSFYVTVNITAATEELEPQETKPGSQRLTVHLAIHMLGEHIPGRTIAFTGDGEATIKQEVGRVVRQADHDYSWDSAAEIAVKDAIETTLKQLAQPAKKP